MYSYSGKRSIERFLRKANYHSKTKPSNQSGEGGSYFPYILLNEIQTVFSQLGKAIIKGLASGFVY